MTTALGLGQVEAKKSFTLSWQGLLEPSLLPPRVCMSKRLGLGAESGIEFKHSNMGCRYPKPHLIAVPVPTAMSV